MLFYILKWEVRKIWFPRKYVYSLYEVMNNTFITIDKREKYIALKLETQLAAYVF